MPPNSSTPASRQHGRWGALRAVRLAGYAAALAALSWSLAAVCCTRDTPQQRLGSGTGSPAGSGMDFPAMARCLEKFLEENSQDWVISHVIGQRKPGSATGATEQSWVWSLGQWRIQRAGNTTGASLDVWLSRFHVLALRVRLAKRGESYMVQDWSAVSKSID